MNREELILNNQALINKCIKDMNLYWNTQDEWQDYYDAGLEGLIIGANGYDESKGYAPSTYLYICIKTSIIKMITYKNRVKNGRDYTTISLETKVNSPEGNETELIDLIPDNRIHMVEDTERESLIEEITEVVDKIQSKKGKIIIKLFYGLDGFPEMTPAQIAKSLNIVERTVYEIKKTAMRQVAYQLMAKERRSHDIRKGTYDRKRTKQVLLVK